MSIEDKLKKELGVNYKEWHTKEVQMQVSKGYDVDTTIKSFIKKLNRKR